MKLFIGKTYFLLFFLITFFSSNAQHSNAIWKKQTKKEAISVVKLNKRAIPKKYEVYQLNINNLKQKLKNVEKREQKSLVSNTILSFPTTTGELEKYEIYEASILDEQLQKKYPNIKSYVGKDVNNSGSVIRFSVSKTGLHAMFFKGGEGVTYIDPYTSDRQSYILYSKKNMPNISSFECLVQGKSTALTHSKDNFSSKATDVNDGKLRTFRLAIATTGEYSQFQLIHHGISSNSTVEQKKEAILSAINTTMTRVNGIFERDLSVTMKLVADNDKIIFLDSETDGFTNDDSNVLIDESQTIIDAAIGFDNYDIGHTFSTGGGGLAILESSCTVNKAKGITGSSYPIGDSYDVDFVAHEMGHQFGANHTFNSEDGNCGGGNMNSATAIEPGSGSTIMSYAGLCAPNNIQNQSDDYFHLVSIKQMWNNITNGNSTCIAGENSGNTVPKVEALSNYTIPIATPFVLNATASDIDNDVLTYTWEQLDNENVTAPPTSTLTEGPVFRSVSPSTSSLRYFPNQSTVAAGDLMNTWEVLPSVARTMKFGVNVRDNNINGGQTASQETTITFNDASGPFKVTSQNTSESWNSEENKTITWDVANTNAAPVNCLNVNILLSIDGGYTFPITLASNISNNGSATILVPKVATTLGRIKVESVNNIFYAINLTNIHIKESSFTLTLDTAEQSVCLNDEAIFNITYHTFLSFNEETTFTASGLPEGASATFNPTTATLNNTPIEMKIVGINNVGAYSISVVGTSASVTKSKEVTLNVFSSNINVPNLIFPANNSSEILTPYHLKWDSDINAKSYEIQIATDSGFTTIVEQATGTENTSYAPNLLTANTQYYWRVRAINNCGQSNYSTIFNFTTANESCVTLNSTDTPKAIPDNDLNGISSTILVTNNRLITHVTVTVNITHSYVSDLKLSLLSPTGTTILLSVKNGGDGDNYTNTVFNDATGLINISNGSAPFTGTYAAQIPLSYLNGSLSIGNWVLNVTDNENGDTGTLENWSIKICGTPVLNDDDGDGVINSIDQCPNTLIGNPVNPSTGCFELAEDNFKIEVVKETCPNKNNGQIKISANKNFNYTTTINGTNYSFTDNLIVENLAPTTYNFCIGVYVEDESKTYEQCFSHTIEAGQNLIGKANVQSNKALIEITSGTAPYNVLINGKPILNTSETSFSVDIKHGDFIEVKSSVSCEGVFSKEILLTDSIIAYPNPTSGAFEIVIPSKSENLTVNIYNAQSQLISSKSYPVIYGKIQLNIENYATGLYIAKIITDKPITLKILKK